ncbi:glycolate oxidase subunit GlcF [Pararobbsia silviterrae]|uniref:Glycolate oxidase iron-sulfur subunit n=1 Tax=Pararobbsia silviterrae TaxID=1792498 RepID=A0A494XFZ1_9BURK|nr:glycolate oxidase subunit GlcF [Pararobbsia silviterrae]RKP48611.1 glycolate oxidase iron-sulfur subunit [Pararobbsia silviterrae]
MQTNLAEFMRSTPDGDEAERILRKCVHCGFCTATCPTYQLLGDELDGPRGRIYLIKQMVEGAPVTRSTQQHLDRCLTCRSCESTCPSGVQYGRLVEIGRKHVEQTVPRTLAQRVLRRALATVLPQPTLFAPMYLVGLRFRRVLPRKLRDKLPARRAAGVRPTRSHPRKMLMLDGCVQPSMMPNINTATARVFDALGVQLVSAPSAGCCGALRLHLSYEDEALEDMRRNIDAWWPHIEAGVEAIVMNASGCGATVREYGHLLRNDPLYAAKARRISELTRDVCEILPGFETELAERATERGARRDLHVVAYHPPCTLQHGQQVRGSVENLLAGLGVEVRLPADSHLCCGSAGTYSILQPGLSYRLRDQKLGKLAATEPQAIVSGNIGCLAHLQSGTSKPVMHWIELVDRMIS